MSHAPTGDATASHAAIEGLYGQLQRPLLAYLTGLTGEREAAEDLIHETFIKALRAWDRRDHSASAAGWIYRIATNTAYDYLRRRRRIRFTPLPEGDHDSPALHARGAAIDEREPVRAALAQLPRHYQDMLVLHSCAGHSLKDLADAFGCTPNAIKTRLYRARACFRRAYCE